MNRTLRFGLCAFGVTFTGNLILLSTLDGPASMLFTADWWQNWTMICAVWIVFVVAGLAHQLRVDGPACEGICPQ